MQFYRQCYLREIGTQTRQMVYIPEEMAHVDAVIEVKADGSNWKILTVGANRTSAEHLSDKQRYNKSFGASIK